mmetsp:Transcript_32246/g.78659  ORF Transcript_32246/g.78659 Transcript_32246/m.78659 type:complete len:676 (+) Transcript_32246:419-2446(+)
MEEEQHPQGDDGSAPNQDAIKDSVSAASDDNELEQEQRPEEPNLDAVEVDSATSAATEDEDMHDFVNDSSYDFENDMDIDDVDLVELWGEGKTMEYVKMCSYSVTIPSSQTRLISLFEQEGFKSVRTTRGQNAGSGSGSGGSSRRQRAADGGNAIAGAMDTLNDANIGRHNFPRPIREFTTLMKMLMNGPERPDTHIRIINQRSDAAKRSNESSKFLYIDMKVNEATATIRDLKSKVHKTWKTIHGKQGLFLPIDKTTVKELQGEDGTLLKDLGVTAGTTALLRHMTEYPEVKVYQDPCDSSWPWEVAACLFWPRLFRSPLFGPPAILLAIDTQFDGDDEEYKFFDPYFRVQFDMQYGRSPKKRTTRGISFATKLRFGNVRRGIWRNAARTANHTEYFVHSLKFDLTSQMLEKAESGGPALNSELAIDSALTNERGETRSVGAEVGRQELFGAHIGGEQNRAVQEETRAQLQVREFAMEQKGASCKLERVLWHPPRRSLQDCRYYDEFIEDRLSGEVTIPVPDDTTENSLHFECKKLNFDFLSVPSVWEFICGTGDKTNREDQSQVVLEVKMLMRKIHRIKVPVPGKNKLALRQFMTENIDSYREVVIRKDFHLCRFPEKILRWPILLFCLLVLSGTIAALILVSFVWHHSNLVDRFVEAVESIRWIVGAVGELL